MVQAAALIVFIAAIAFWWYQAARLKRRRLMLTLGRSTRKSFHCVEIQSGVTACEAVQKLSGKRFLSDEAPQLPVPGCSAHNCTCSYIHFEDRRQHDRRNPYGMWASIPPAITGERRARSDRRKSPESTFKPSLAR